VVSSASAKTFVHTGSHWGLYDAEVEDGRVVGVRPFPKDPHPSRLIDAIPSAVHAASRIQQPMVRQGGVQILFHPVPWEFHPVHHPSYIDFFEEILAETTDPAQIESKFEQQYATDPWYVHLYRNSHAYHGVHPFYMWYWGAHALDHLGDVIFVGSNRRAVRRMGFRTASTFPDALEMATIGGWLVEAGTSTDAIYAFRHPLMREAVTAELSARFPALRIAGARPSLFRAADDHEHHAITPFTYASVAKLSHSRVPPPL
jgi:hypothetical protein